MMPIEHPSTAALVRPAGRRRASAPSATRAGVPRRASPAGIRLLARLLGTLLLPAALAAGSAGEVLAEQPLAVAVTAASTPTACAEDDNVTLNFASAEVRRLSITAAHPAYLASVKEDSFAPDWTGCARPALAPSPPAGDSKRTTLYERIDLWVVGLTFPSFWRPATATVRVGDRVAKGLHLIQVWMLRPMGGEEVLVLYPQDGYWRLRPLAPAGRAPTAFGSSFLIGPVEVSTRPHVAIRDIAFEPQTRTFTLAFERGGTATVRMAAIDEHRHTLNVAFTRPIAGQPFAALRSMYVTELDNDAQRIAVLERDAKGWREDPVMGFAGGAARALWLGRVTPSRHNTSSPDMVFDAFTGD
jgi:hypothetical protein